MPILEVSDDGILHVPSEMLPGGKPHSQYALEYVGKVALLRPAGSDQPVPQQATPAERVEAFERWLNAPRPEAPDLPIEALSRESVYD